MAPRTTAQAVAIACFDADGPATHRTACALHGIGGFELHDSPEVLIHERRNHRSGLARLRTTSTLDPVDITEVDGIPCTTIARTLLLLASIAGLRRTGKEIAEWAVEDAFDDALGSGKVTLDEIEETLARCRRSGRGGVVLIERLVNERRTGAISESHLERSALDVLSAAGTVLPVCQARVAPDGEFVARVDFLYPQHKAVIEVLGYRWHRTEAQMDHDASRRRALTHRGFRVFDFTYRDVMRRPGTLVATARAILAEGAGGERRSAA